MGVEKKTKRWIVKNITDKLNEAIRSGRRVRVTTKKWRTRTVVPHSIQNGILHCDVVLVELLGDSAHNNAQIKIADIAKAEITL